METETKVIIGGVVVAALLGFWWYEKKKSAGALPTAGGVPASAPPGSLPAGTPGAPPPGGPLQGANQPPAQPPAGQLPPAVPPAMNLSYITPMAQTQSAQAGAPTGAATSFAAMADPTTATQPAASAIQVQQWLNILCASPPVPVTNAWDTNTKSALASFQSAMSLPPTGFADSTTVAYLQGKALDAQLPGNKSC